MSRGLVVWMSGLSGSGKTTLAGLSRDLLEREGLRIKILDGDEVRRSATKTLGFSREDIEENNRILTKLCASQWDRQDVLLVSVISPFHKSRQAARDSFQDRFILVYIKASVHTVAQRDPKGLYAQARKGLVRDVVGLPGGVPYEVPKDADLILDTERWDVKTLARTLTDFIQQHLSRIRVGFKTNSKVSGDMRTPLFTTGTARGGTNLLAKMLNVSSDIYLASDPFLPLFRSLRSAILQSTGDAEILKALAPEAPLSDYYFSSAKLRAMEAIQEATLDLPFHEREWPNLLHLLAARASLSSSNLVAHLDRLRGASYLEVFRNALELIHWASGMGNRRWVGFNENWAIEFFPALARAFPAARFIIILRDPRAPIASALREKDLSKVPHVISFARHWRKMVALMLKYRRDDLFRDRLYVLTYETLVSSPERTAREMAEFLEIPYDSRMLDTDQYQDADGSPWKGNSHFEAPNRGIYVSSIDRWKTSLAPAVVEVAEFICAPDMQLLGYEPVEYLSSDALPGTSALEFIFRDSKSCQGWRTDFAEIEKDVGFELFRKGLCRGGYGSTDRDLIRRSYLTQEAWDALREDRPQDLSAMSGQLLNKVRSPAG